MSSELSKEAAERLKHRIERAVNSPGVADLTLNANVVAAEIQQAIAKAVAEEDEDLARVRRLAAEDSTAEQRKRVAAEQRADAAEARLGEVERERDELKGELQWDKVFSKAVAHQLGVSMEQGFSAEDVGKLVSILRQQVAELEGALRKISRCTRHDESISARRSVDATMEMLRSSHLPCLRHTEAVSECSHCNLLHLLDSTAEVLAIADQALATPTEADAQQEGEQATPQPSVPPEGYRVRDHGDRWLAEKTNRGCHAYYIFDDGTAANDLGAGLYTKRDDAVTACWKHYERNKPTPTPTSERAEVLRDASAELEVRSLDEPIDLQNGMTRAAEILRNMADAAEREAGKGGGE